MYMTIKIYDTLGGNRQSQITVADKTLNTRNGIPCKKLHCRDSNYEEFLAKPLNVSEPYSSRRRNADTNRPLRLRELM